MITKNFLENWPGPQVFEVSMEALIEAARAKGVPVRRDVRRSLNLPPAHSYSFGEQEGIFLIPKKEEILAGTLPATLRVEFHFEIHPVEKDPFYEYVSWNYLGPRIRSENPEAWKVLLALDRLIKQLVPNRSWKKPTEIPAILLPHFENLVPEWGTGGCLSRSYASPEEIQEVRGKVLAALF